MSSAPSSAIAPTVSVPVLSVHSVSMPPRSSIASSRRTSTPPRARRRAPRASDTLTIAGTVRDVERAGKALGYIERSSSETDVVFVGLGVVIGGFLGLLAVQVGNVPLSLTASGGALVMGLVFGWLRSVWPTFGRIPEPALWVFDTVGLAVFIGLVGLAAGPVFVEGLRRTGPSLLLVGMVVAVTPHLTALFFLSGYVPRRLRADSGAPERAGRKRRTTVRFTRSR